MKIEEAEILGVPEKTRSEEKEQEFTEVQDMFSGEDISRLDLSFKRNRKIAFNDIDEYLKELNFKPDMDGDECQHQENQSGMFKKNYKMRLVQEVSFQDQELGSREEALDVKSLKSPPLLDQKVTTSTNEDKKELLLFSSKSQFVKQKIDLGEISISRVLQVGEVKNRKIGILKGIKSSKVSMNHQGIFLSCEENIADIIEQNSVFDKSDGELVVAQNQITTGQTLVSDLLRDATNEDVTSLVWTSPIQDCDFLSKPSVIQSLFFSILVEDQELILFEFKAEGDEANRHQLRAVHTIRCSSALQSNLIQRLKSITKQEGFCPLVKLFCKLLGLNMNSVAVFQELGKGPGIQTSQFETQFDLFKPEDGFGCSKSLESFTTEHSMNSNAEIDCDLFDAVKPKKSKNDVSHSL